jgi:katanin p60 ATPase-containing subunit A1
MSRNHTILDLNDYVKLARELDILGDYEKALSKYKTALKIVTERKSQVKDLSLRDKWNQIENLIKNEIIMTHEALKIARTFQNDDESRLERARQEEMRNNQILMRDYQPEQPREEIKKTPNKKEYDPRWERFGGIKPFDVWKKGNNPDELKKPKRDPNSVFTPQNKQKNQNQGFNRERAKNYNNGGKGYGGNFNKAPPKANPKGNDKNNNDKQPDPKSGKSAFYLHHYPEGEGPDGELIEMVEREVMEKNPNVKFEDIAELEGAKNTLKEAVLLPLLMPDFFRGIRRPWKGVLLYGPPGTGKTLLAKALATQGKTTFFNVSPTTFASKWKGESEKLVRILFEMARFYAPSTIFIDEVDSIGQKRSDGDNEASRKVMAEMLVQMDGVSGKLDQEDISIEELKKNIVMVMGATNLPWDLDDALRRRFEKRVYIPLPNSVGRREMFNINMKGIQVEESIDMDKLVQLTDGYSGADIANVCREASLMQMRRKLMKTGGKLNFTAIKLNPSKTLIDELDAPVTQNDFELAIKNISKSVSQNDIKKYEQFTEEYSNK